MNKILKEVLLRGALAGSGILNRAADKVAQQPETSAKQDVEILLDKLGIGEKERDAVKKAIKEDVPAMAKAAADKFDEKFPEGSDARRNVKLAALGTAVVIGTAVVVSTMMGGRDNV
jgi:hypothetical protein